MKRVLVIGALLAAACQQELGRPPVPRFTIEPEYVPEGDAHETPVALDSSESADELDDPSAPLDVTWQFDDDDVRFEEGGAHDPSVVVTAAGARPVTIILTVTDPDGLSSSLTRRLGIVVPED